MSAGQANGRAATRRVQNNTPTHGAGAAGDALAQAVVAAWAPFAAQLAQHITQLAQALAPQKTGCLYCAARRKITQTAYAAALAAARTEYEIARKAAAELGSEAPEWTEPEPPALPEVQEAFTWVPVQPVKGAAPVTIPVCYDDLPDRPAEDAPAQPAGPQAPYRPAGLVDVAGRQILVPNE